MNQELYNQFLNAAAVIAEREKFSSNINKKKTEIDQLKLNISIAEKKPKTSNKQYNDLTIIGIIFSALGFLPIVFGLFIWLERSLSSLQNGFESGNNLDNNSFNFFYIFIALILACLPIAIIGLCLIQIARKKRVDFKNNAIKEHLEVKSQIEPLIVKKENELRELHTQFKQYIEESNQILAFLPVTYQNLKAIGFMISALENLRADNLTDVINLYEQELHYLAQMQVLRQTQAMQKIHSENMLHAITAIQKNQDRINSNLKKIKALQTIDILKD